MKIFGLFILLTLLGTLLAAIVWLAMWPGKIAVERGHPQADAIRIAGWLGILTGVIWIGAMIWAFTRVDAGSQASGKLEQRVAELESRVGSTGDAA
jgi:hypothetical protein